MGIAAEIPLPSNEDLDFEVFPLVDNITMLQINTTITWFDVPTMRAHVALAIIAWVGCSGIGTMMAKHFRRTFMDKKIMGCDVWLFVHATCMTLTFVLTIISFILAFVSLNGWNTTKHAILGILLMAIVTVQPILIIIKPCFGPEGVMKINFMHFFVGTNVGLVGIVVCYYGLALPSFQQPDWIWIIITFFLASHLLTDTILRIIERISQAQIKKDNLSENSLKDAPLAKHRRMQLLKYLVLNVGFTTALVVITTMAPWVEYQT